MKYERPVINVSLFNEENIVVSSGADLMNSLKDDLFNGTNGISLDGKKGKEIENLLTIVL